MCVFLSRYANPSADSSFVIDQKASVHAELLRIGTRTEINVRRLIVVESLQSHAEVDRYHPSLVRTAGVWSGLGAADQGHENPLREPCAGWPRETRR